MVEIGKQEASAPAESRRLLVLGEAEIEFLKDALWCAVVAEQLATSGDPAWERAFLADLRVFMQHRQSQGRAGFQDLFLELTGTPLADLPPELRRHFVGDGLGLPTEADTIKLVGVLRSEIADLSQQLAQARQTLAARQARPRRRWWPFRRE
ncbi:MAG: hypothetical protein HY331_14560 [Chloroflexi bacterium]|nr:hypothetical protein [Chloroflexota bacterium]